MTFFMPTAAHTTPTSIGKCRWVYASRAMRVRSSPSARSNTRSATHRQGQPDDARDQDRNRDRELRHAHADGNDRLAQRDDDEPGVLGEAPG